MPWVVLDRMCSICVCCFRGWRDYKAAGTWGPRGCHWDLWVTLKGGGGPSSPKKQSVVHRGQKDLCGRLWKSQFPSEVFCGAAI